ncbi:MAG: helix-turn-helix transcriptional regulator [Clostridia bacterium]|nr:helix-turn-helix transcriptional regulator [Clostridia bacterium]
MKIGNKIKELMAVKGYTQQKVAEMLGVRQNTVSQWITDTNEPNCQTIIALCKILDTTPNELLGWED